MKLFYSPGACSLAPHILARELDLEVEFVPVPILKGANAEPEYLAINPRARVPALQVGDSIFTETPALLLYLASTKPTAGLTPPIGSYDFARCLEWMSWFTSSLHIGYAQFWRPERFLPPASDGGVFVANAKRQVAWMNDEIESRLDGQWFAGTRYSIADIYALPFYRWGNRIGLAMKDRCPRWHAWAQRVLQRPAVRAAIEHEGIGFNHFDEPVRSGVEV